MDRYRAAIRQLLDADGAYYCYCTVQELEDMRAAARARGDKPKYDGRCRDRGGPPPAGRTPVVRFKSPQDGEIEVDDLIQGRVVYRNSELDDLIIARADGTPTYNFTVVIDDVDMHITHVIRGDDHLNNAPRQIHIFNALGVTPPHYAHIPLILGPDGQKLSKRHGTVSVLEYREQGYLPEALLNFLVRLGWSHGDQEIFSREEMIALFDIGAVNKSAAAINPDKLLWLNQHYLKTGDADRLAGLLGAELRRIGLDPAGGPDLREVVLVQRERTRTLREMAEASRIFYADFAEFDAAAANKQLVPAIRAPLARLQERLAELRDWSSEALHRTLEETAAESGLKIGKLAQPLRVALTGTAVSPSIDHTLRLLGRERSLAAIGRALHRIDSHSAA
jgi:glutamyl-tRNA synthetase